MFLNYETKLFRGYDSDFAARLRGLGEVSLGLVSGKILGRHGCLISAKLTIVGCIIRADQDFKLVQISMRLNPKKPVDYFIALMAVS